MADIDCSEEVWRPIVGYDGYSVSSHGRVRSETVMVRDALGRTYLRTGRLLRLLPGSKGYVTTGISHKGKNKTLAVSTLVASAFLGPRPAGQEVCHDDGVPGNNHADNLRYDTHLGNIRDKARHGTILDGERHPNSKLTLEQVKEIRASSISGIKLAAKFGIAFGQIYAIKNGKAWRASLE